MRTTRCALFQQNQGEHVFPPFFLSLTYRIACGTISYLQQPSGSKLLHDAALDIRQARDAVKCPPEGKRA